MQTYLMMLVVQSEDPASLLQLAEAAHRDAGDARLAARLLHEDGRVRILTAPHVLFREDYPAVLSMGRVDHEEIRIEASVGDGTGIVAGSIFIDDDVPLHRSFVVARDHGGIAQVLREDMLLIAMAAMGGEPMYASDSLPAGADTARGRRQLLDELLVDPR